MNLSKIKITNKGLYWGLIFTFALLYLCVGFVSTLHSITFFQLANTMSLAILLGLTYEIGQAAVLFSILMSKRNKESYLSWALMFLLTALQVTANVYASFKFMATSGSNDWQYWQKAILFGVQAENAEMYQMIISWIAGALLPIVALGMTALVAQNMKFMEQEEETDKKEPEKVGSVPDEEVDEVINNEVNKRVAAILSLSKASEPKAEVVPSPEPEVLNVPIDSSKIAVQDENPDIEEKLLDEEAERLTSLIPEKIDLPTQSKIVDVQPSSFIVPEENLPEVSDKIEVLIHPDAEKQIVQATINEVKESIPGKYEQKFGSEFTSEMNKIKDEIKEKPPKKKAGRPPKQKEMVTESKKDQELLPKEVVEVPQKPKRIVNPLKTKGKKIKPVKSLKEFVDTPSTGDKIIQIIETINKDKDKETINNDIGINLDVPEVAPASNKVPYIEGGVEVVDVKAVPKPEEVKKNESAGT